MCVLCVHQAEDDVIRSGILEITDKQSVVLLSAIAMAMDLQEDAAPTDKNALAMEVIHASLHLRMFGVCEVRSFLVVLLLLRPPLYSSSIWTSPGSADL